MTSETTIVPSDSPTEIVLHNKPVNLDKLDASQISTEWKFEPNLLAQRAKAMVENIEGLKKERAIKAILAGLYLHEVKAALGHGSFGAWKAEHFPKSNTQLSNYMGLAAKFCRSSKLLLPELIAANQITLDLTTADEFGATAKAKLEKFVGNIGLTDLLTRHGIVKRGGAKTKTVALPAPASGSDTPPPEPTADEGCGIAFKNCFDALETAEKSLLSDINWALLDEEKAGMIEAKLKALEARFHERLLELRHVSATS